MIPQRAIRLGYFVSHPIQYQAPLLRRIAQQPGIDLHVLFGSDFSIHSYSDPGFNRSIAWDVALLEGYSHQFLRPLFGNRRGAPLRGLLAALRGSQTRPPVDVLWVHGYHTLPAFQAMLAATALSIPVLLRADSRLDTRTRPWARRVGKRLYFRLLRDVVRGTLPIGTLNAAYWTTCLGHGIPQFPMPYAVDNHFFESRSHPPHGDLTDLAQELQLDPGHQVILFASKLLARKRCSDLISAYAQFCRDRGERGLPAPYLLVVGDGPERFALEQQAQAARLPFVRFCGFQNQSSLPRFFALADVLVLPSQHEPWGLIINEFMNAARPVIISSDVGCQPDLVSDGVEGCVFPVGNIPALTHALHRVLDHPENARNMGQQALQRIQHWSFEEDIQALQEALHVVTNHARTQL